MADFDPTKDPTVQELLRRISHRAAVATRARLARGREAPSARNEPAPRPAQPVSEIGDRIRYGRRRADPPRAVPQDEALDATAVALLQSLPANLQLLRLRRQFPRIVNHIATLWDDAVAMHDYLDSLMIDRRGNRQGFPPGVLDEIRSLRAHHLRRVRLGRS